MKSAYVKPSMVFEGFEPTEYVAACYRIECIGNFIFSNSQNVHECSESVTYVHDGMYGNHPGATLNGTPTEVTISEAVTDLGQILYLLAHNYAPTWLGGTGEGWDGFIEDISGKTKTAYRYGSHYTWNSSETSDANAS